MRVAPQHAALAPQRGRRAGRAVGDLAQPRPRRRDQDRRLLGGVAGRRAGALAARRGAAHDGCRARRLAAPAPPRSRRGAARRARGRDSGARLGLDVVRCGPSRRRASSWISGVSNGSTSARRTPAAFARSKSSVTRTRSRSRASATQPPPCVCEPSSSFSPRSRACSSQPRSRKSTSPSHGSSIASACSAIAHDRLDPLLEERVDQLLLVREAAVDGADADAGVVGDVVQRHAQPALGEQLSRGGQDALAVALGVLAQGARRRGR